MFILKNYEHYLLALSPVTLTENRQSH